MSAERTKEDLVAENAALREEVARLTKAMPLLRFDDEETLRILHQYRELAMRFADGAEAPTAPDGVSIAPETLPPNVTLSAGICAMRRGWIDEVLVRVTPEGHIRIGLNPTDSGIRAVDAYGRRAGKSNPPRDGE